MLELVKELALDQASVLVSDSAWALVSVRAMAETSAQESVLELVLVSEQE